MAAHPLQGATTMGDIRSSEPLADSGFEPTDQELIAQARAGSPRAADILIARYRSFARFKARNYFLPGADRDDLLQESMIGLFNAIRSFDPAKGRSFMVFADLCVERQIHTAIKKANRHGQRLFERAARLDAKPFHDDGDDRPLPQALWTDVSQDPHSLVEAADEIDRARSYLLRALTDIEAEALWMYSQGMRYQDIAASLEMSTKGIDNALQRARRKVNSFLEEQSQPEPLAAGSTTS